MKKKNVNEKISVELGIDISENNEKSKNEIVSQKDLNYKQDFEQDYKSVRANLKDIIDQGNGAIEGIINVASETESPRAYEVAAQMIKTIAEANKDLLGLHKQIKEIKKEENVQNYSQTNNAIYVGSTKELQALVNQSRSAIKSITNDTVVDVETETDG